MKIEKRLLEELQNRLKVGNRRDVHLNAIPGRSRYKFDLNRLSYINKHLPQQFLEALLTEKNLSFKISWQNNIGDLNTLFEEEQVEIVKISKSFENLVNQTETIEAEKGINTFGFGFPLLVRRGRKDNELTIAPIVIWSLRIKRGRTLDTWIINRNEEDPIYMNELLINYLSSDIDAKVDPIPDEMLEDGIVDKEELVSLCAEVLKVINSTVTSEVEEIFGHKLNFPKKIESKEYYEKLGTAFNNALIEFAGLFSIFEVAKQNIIQDFDNLLELEGLSIGSESLEEYDFESITSVETDPSQQGILNTIGKAKDLLIQGPPGTGKSQTLTAILINALQNQKKTLVVCEKITALSVLEEALKRRNLSELYILLTDVDKKGRKNTVDSVRDRVDSDLYKYPTLSHNRSELVSVIENIKGLIEKINAAHASLRDKIVANMSWTEAVGTYLREQRYKNSSFSFKPYTFAFETEEFTRILGIISEAERLYKNFKAISRMSFLNSTEFNSHNPLQLEADLKKRLSDFWDLGNKLEISWQTLKKEYVEKREKDLKEFESRVETDLDLICAYSGNFDELILNFCLKYEELRSADFERDHTLILDQIEKVDSILDKWMAKPQFLNERRTQKSWFKLLCLLSPAHNSLRKDQEQVREHLKSIYSLCQNSDYFIQDFNRFLSLKEGLDEFESLKRILTSKSESINQLITSNLKRYQLNDLISKREAFKRVEQLHNELDKLKTERKGDYLTLVAGLKNSLEEFETRRNRINKEFADSEIDCPNIDQNQTIEDQSEMAQKIRFDFDQYLEKLHTLAQIEFDELPLSMNSEYIKSLKSFQGYSILLEEFLNHPSSDLLKTHILKRAEDQPSKLFRLLKEENDKNDQYWNSLEDPFSKEYEWYRFFFSLDDGTQNVLNQLTASDDNWESDFISGYLELLLISLGSNTIPTNDSLIIELVRHFDRLEKLQIQYIKHLWQAKQEKSIRIFENESTHTIANLYRKRSHGTRKRLPLRKIVRGYPDLFTDFFPVILTTPEVASNLFGQKQKYFDIVLFDESSQLKLEDTLPAMTKGRQLIVAGDEHQMPPSYYFSKMYEGVEDELEESDAEDALQLDLESNLLTSESLLDFASMLKFEKHFLDFHYRSEHPALIEFSNHAFYGKRLVPLSNLVDYVPIQSIKVNGEYKDRTNETEAEMVLQILLEGVLPNSEGKLPTVGVATMNVPQRDLIKNLIEEKIRMDTSSEASKKLSRLIDDGLFVKNLENIQGDERDLIIISTTYGYDQDGIFAQRFGPINQKNGYRLLNVIITRAKFKVFVVTSIPEVYSASYRDLLMTKGSRNGRAAFYAYLTYARLISADESELANQLLNELYEKSGSVSSHTEPVWSSEVESPFEEEVYESLVRKFGEQKIIPQYRFGGFRIDLVYDHGQVDIPLIAIECDGAKYHSSHEAYLYDRHRQKILEKSGFVFHRIWSTNWFRNRQREEKALFEFIESKIQNKRNFYDSSLSKYTSFRETFKHEETPLLKSSRPSQLEADLFNDRVRNSEISNVDNVPLVGVGSRVQIKYLNTGNILDVKIVDRELSRDKHPNGIQLISSKSAVGVAILGHKQGDKVKIGQLGRIVELLEVYQD